MKASVIIATYNRKKKLKKCLKKIFNQDFPIRSYEIIVVDDGSNDGTYEFLREKQKEFKNLFVLRQKNKGPAAARNYAIKKAKSNLIFFTDDDVLVPKNWMSTYFNFLKKNKEVVAVGGYLEASNKTIKKNIFARYEKIISRIIYGMPNKTYIGGFETYGIVTNNSAYRKEEIEKAGYFDENFKFAAAEDVDLKLRISLKNKKFAFLPLKATHIQDYTFKRFLSQLRTRVKSDKIFFKKWKNTLKKQKSNQISKLIDIFLKLIKKKNFDVLALFIFVIIYNNLYKLWLDIKSLITQNNFHEQRSNLLK